MKELTEIRINGTDLLLEDNLVRGSILPEKSNELARNVIFKGDTIVEGPVYGHRIEVRRGDINVQGAIFARSEFYINIDADATVTLHKCLGSAGSVVARGSRSTLNVLSDINARSVALSNAFVAGSIYADDIELENCVVAGGVFATGDINLRHSMIGTFNAPTVSVGGTNYLLLPSAFSIEPLRIEPEARVFNLSLADLGALYRGVEPAERSGKIEVNLDNDTLVSTLTDDSARKTLRSYTVAGKVLAADLVDTDRFQNHFLLTATALGGQMLKTYDLGPDAQGNPVPLDINRLRSFFFDILEGRIAIDTLSGSFDIAEMTRKGRLD